MTPKTIAIVEDDKDIQTLLEIILDKNDYTIIKFSNIRECEDYVLMIVPDLFILDVRLPDGNGIGYCSELKSREHLKDTPVMVISAHATSAEALESGADRFIAKPFDLEHLLACTYELLKVA